MAWKYCNKLRVMCSLGICQRHSLRLRQTPYSTTVFAINSLLNLTTQIYERQMCTYSAHVSSHLLTYKRTALCDSCSPLKRLPSKRCMGSSVVTKFTQNIDLDKLRQEVKRQSKETGEQVQLVERVREIVAQRCAETIANFSEEDKKKLQIIQLEHNFLYSEGHDIVSPDAMTDEIWLEAMELASRNRRLKYYLHLQKKSYMKEATQKKKEALKEERRDLPRQQEYEHGRLFMRIYEQTMRKWLNYRLASAMQLGTPLVFDMDYAHLMRSQEQKNTANQLHDVYCLNRSLDYEEPFHLYFTGCPTDNEIMKLLQIKVQDNPILLSTVTEKSYLDLFDKERLVYLSPHGKQVMRRFDHDAVYIVGAFNDKATQKPVSYARAIEQGIKCQRLPIDEHISWNQGAKSLTLDQMIKIMLDLKDHKSWKTAFRAIPQRKLR